MEVITKDMEEVKAYFEALERGTKYVDNVTANFHPGMNGEVYLTGEEVCRILHITTRTLQDYRAQRIIPFISLPGKTLYRQSDLLRMLEESGGFTHGDRLLLADLFLFPVKDFLLHGCEVAGDRTEIGAYHLVSHFGVYLCGADMLVTEYF